VLSGEGGSPSPSEPQQIKPEKQDKKGSALSGAQ
jgi:hypothetical protein